MAEGRSSSPPHSPPSPLSVASPEDNSEGDNPEARRRQFRRRHRFKRTMTLITHSLITLKSITSVTDGRTGSQEHFPSGDQGSRTTLTKQPIKCSSTWYRLHTYYLQLMILLTICNASHLYFLGTKPRNNQFFYEQKYPRDTDICRGHKMSFQIDRENCCRMEPSRVDEGDYFICICVTL